MDAVTAAKVFVKDKLCVDFVPDKYDLLNKIVRAFFEKVPYQNVSTSILPAEERFPTEQVVVENGRSLKGGLGVHNNWFMKMLLEALGYNVEFLPGTFESPPSAIPRKPGSHFAILVKDLNRRGDLHLVDVGTSFPIFKAVPLDKLPFTATEVTVTYKIVDEDGQWHGDTKDPNSESWTRFVSYDKISTKESPGTVFRGPVLDFLKEQWLVGGITAIHYPQPRSSAIPDIPDFKKDFDYAVRYHNDVIIFTNSDGFTWEERIPQDQIVSTLHTYFPTIPKADVEKKVQALSEEASLLRF